MKLYRVDKLAKRDGIVIKKKHILAASDAQAVRQAEDSDDCPICDVVRDRPSGRCFSGGVVRSGMLSDGRDCAMRRAGGPANVRECS